MSKETENKDDELLNEDINTDSAEESNEEIETSEENETSEDASEDMNEDTSDSSSSKSDSNDENKEESNKKTIVLIVEIIIVLLAISFIIYAIVSKSKQNEGGTNPSGKIGTEESANGNVVSSDSVAPADVDNSALYENIPEIPDVASLNSIDLTEADSLVAENKLIKLTTKDGIDVYVQNYNDTDYLKSEISINDAKIEEQIYQNVLSKHLVDAPADKSVAELYDTVDIDYSGKIDGVVFDGGTAEGQSLALGSHSFIEGFEEGVVGMKVGETKDITTHFPESYPNNPDLAGKEAIFTVKLNKIVSEAPELTDEIAAQEYPDLKTASAVRENIKINLLKSQIDSFLLKSFYVNNVNKDKVINYYNSTMDYYVSVFSMQYGVSIEEMLTQQGGNIEDLKKDTLYAATASAMSSEVYRAIAEANNIEISEEDATNFAESNGIDLETLYEQYGEDTIDDYIVCDKVLEFIAKSL